MKKILLRLLFFSGMTGVFFIAKTNQNGPGAGYTNAPSESNCAASSCHNSSSLVTSGTNWNRINLSNNFTGSGYIPDSTYELVLTYKETGMSKSGFQITCLDGTNSPAGTFSTLDSRTQTMSQSVGGKTRYYLGHTGTGSSTISTDTSSYRISWTAPSKNVGNVTFYTTWNKANGNGNQSGDLIYAKTFTAGPSSLLPTAKAFIQQTDYCTNSALTFDINSSGSPTSYTWSFPGGAPSSSTSKSPIITYFTTGTYKAIVSVKNSKGSSLPDTLTFTVKQGASLPVITPAGTREICSGDSLQLSASLLAGHTYRWNPKGETNRIIKVADSGLYSVTVTNSNNCTRTSSPVTVKVNPKPTVLAIKSFSGDTICSGEQFTIAAIVLTGKSDSFSFVSSAGPFIDSNKFNDKLISGSKTYSVWGKSDKGCVSSGSTIKINSKTRPAGPVLSSSNIDYTGFRVNWSAVSGATGYKVSVDSGKTFITPSSGSTGLYHDVTGLLGNFSMNVKVLATLAGKCTETEVSNISVTTLSCTPLDFTVSAGTDRVCKNSTAEVKLNNLAGKNIGIQIDGVNAANDTIQNIVVTSTRDYIVSVIDSNALICGYTNKAIRLVEDTIETPVLTPSGIFAICSNSTTENLTVSLNANNRVDSAFFYQNAQIVSKGKSLSHQFTVKSGDSITAMVTNANGCLSEQAEQTNILFKPVPDAKFSVSNVNFDYTFTANDTTGNHTWKTSIDSTTGFTVLLDFTAYKNDTAVVTHTIEKNGCSATETLKIFVPDFAGIDVKGIDGMRIFPNPASNQFLVMMPFKTTNAMLDLYNTNGELVLTANLRSGQNQIYTEQLADGLYIYRINSLGKESKGNLIIKR